MFIKKVQIFTLQACAQDNFTETVISCNKTAAKILIWSFTLSLLILFHMRKIVCLPLRLYKHQFNLFLDGEYQISKNLW